MIITTEQPFEQCPQTRFPGDENRFRGFCPELLCRPVKIILGNAHGSPAVSADQNRFRGFCPELVAGENNLGEPEPFTKVQLFRSHQKRLLNGSKLILQLTKIVCWDSAPRARFPAGENNFGEVSQESMFRAHQNICSS